jgi:nucleosome binding factor SPN SPT16 subunit
VGEWHSSHREEDDTEELSASAT